MFSYISKAYNEALINNEFLKPYFKNNLASSSMYDTIF
jgi:hypothetical protein